MQIVEADLQLNHVCPSSMVAANVISRPPEIVRVYSVDNGVFTVGEEITLRIDFDLPVVLKGVLSLELNSITHPLAICLNQSSVSTVSEYIYSL